MDALHFEWILEISNLLKVPLITKYLFMSMTILIFVVLLYFTYYQGILEKVSQMLFPNKKSFTLL